MEKKIYNIEPHIFHIEELSFQDFAQQKLSVPNFFQSHFEQKIQEVLKTNKEICVLNSGTSAIHLALKISKVKPQDIVFCSNATFIASVNPVLYEGAEPYFIDIDKNTGNMNPVYLERAIIKCIELKKKPKAIIVTHSYGVPAEMDKLIEIKNKYGLVLIEDAAEALGSLYKGKSCGTIGDYGVISFNTNKLSTTLGGGALVLNSLEEKNRVKSLASQAKINSISFQHSESAYNYLMNDMSAYLGIHQLKFIDKELEKKSIIHNWYKEAIPYIKSATLLFGEDKENTRSNKWMNCLLLTNKTEKTKVLKKCLKEGVEVREFWYPLSDQKFLNKYLYEGKNESREFHERILCLPSGIKIKKEDIKLIIHALKFESSLN